ncbi:MAG: hypothetical protein ABI346_01930 [Candidatus Baltobacteraceae bacterium]
MRYQHRLLAVAAFATFALIGCGGGKSATTQKAAGPVTEAQREAAALPGTSVAAVPRGLHCGGQKPVWVNLKSKAYHAFGDPYYGRSRSGEYLCASDAEAKGYHAAGAMHHHRRSGGSMTNNGAENPAPGATY